MPVGVYNREQRTRYQNVSKTLTFDAATDPSTAPFITGRTGYTIYVQRVLFVVTTSAAQSITVRDSNATPKVIAVLPSLSSVGTLEFNFGDDGVPLTQGKNLDIAASGAGVAGTISVEAYLRPTGTLTAATF
jgi:hypothetical protein